MADTKPSVEYVQRRFDQLEAALDQHDGDLAVSIIKLIEADGYPDLAKQIIDGLIEKGLENLVARAREAST